MRGFKGWEIYGLVLIGVRGLIGSKSLELYGLILIGKTSLRVIRDRCYSG